MRRVLVTRKKMFTLPNFELIVNVVGFRLLVLEYGLGCLDIFIFEGHVLYDEQ
jgi:hypothetical protein